MPTVKDVLEKLNRDYKPEEHIAVAIWCEDDVIDRAQERHMTITAEEAREILDTIDNKQDCSIGISWDVIDAYLDELKDSLYR